MIWGSSFLFIRMAVPTYGPGALIALRVGSAALVLLLFALVRRQRLAWRGRVGTLLLIGILNSTLPFFLISFAEIRLDPGLAAILNATTPLFTALLAARFSRHAEERLTVSRLMGIVLGITGIGILFGGGAIPHDLIGEISAAAVLFASLSYGLAAIVTSRKLADMPPPQIALGQQSFAFLTAVPLAVGLHPSAVPPTYATLAVVALGVLGTAVAFNIAYWLIQHAGPTRATSVTLLVPVFALLWGWLFLGEAIGWSALLGLAAVLASIRLVMRPAKPNTARPGVPREA